MKTIIYETSFLAADTRAESLTPLNVLSLALVYEGETHAQRATDALKNRLHEQLEFGAGLKLESERYYVGRRKTQAGIIVIRTWLDEVSDDFLPNSKKWQVTRA